MTYKIVFRPEAELELAGAYGWYEERRRGLGEDQLDSVESVVESICEKRESYPVVHLGIRRAFLQRFPYGIFYLVEDEHVVVLAVFHASRDPRHWQIRK
ncbi:MAG: type II toxin-antitoxin system RelE/ParE family toxin [Phycisphaerales bacterium]|nr:type II toxin-antitoxin system RelE/ParE family toxin [Phycisphaerales bacterium]